MLRGNHGSSIMFSEALGRFNGGQKRRDTLFTIVIGLWHFLLACVGSHDGRGSADCLRYHDVEEHLREHCGLWFADYSINHPMDGREF